MPKIGLVKNLNKIRKIFFNIMASIEAGIEASRGESVREGMRENNWYCKKNSYNKRRAATQVQRNKERAENNIS